MAFFDNFTVFNFDEGVPYVSVTKNGVTFNKAVIMKLDYPAHVCLLINNDEKQIAIQACHSNEPNSVKFFKPKKDPRILSVRWNSKDLLNTIESMMHWDLEHIAYRIDGILIKEENAMLFDLKYAKELS